MYIVCMLGSVQDCDEDLFRRGKHFLWLVTFFELGKFCFLCVIFVFFHGDFFLASAWNRVSISQSPSEFSKEIDRPWRSLPSQHPEPPPHFANGKVLQFWGNFCIFDFWARGSTPCSEGGGAGG